MATSAEFRRIALQQPGAEEKSHFEQPDFRVNGKIFATLPRQAGIGVLKLPPEVMLGLVLEDDVTFEPAKGFERGGWTRIRLDRITVARLRELTPLAWAAVTPKRQQAEHTKAATKPKPKRDSTRTPKRPRKD